MASLADFFRVRAWLLVAAALVALSCSAREATSVDPRADQAGAIAAPPAPEPPRFTPAADIQPLTLDHVFKKEPVPGYRLDPGKVRTIIATGDVIPARTTNWQMVQKNNFKYPFERTADLLQSADLTLVNLESPLVKGCQPTNQGLTFCGDQRFVEGLTYAGVDVANLANNHSDNYGAESIAQTVELLTASGIDVVGIDNSLVEDLRGIRFGFLAYNGVGLRFDREAIRRDITTLRPRVDVLIVAMHWGKEYVSVPDATPNIADDDPRQIGHLVIDAGADIVIGNHPHWVQGLEFYKGKLITYAHGNFIFDQEWSRETKEGVVGKYTFYESRLIDVEFTPVLIEDYAQPRFPPEVEGRAILERMEEASRKMAQD